MPLGLTGPESFGDYTDPFYQQPQPEAAPAPTGAPAPAPAPITEAPQPGPASAPAEDQTGPPISPPKPPPPPPPAPTGIEGVQGSDVTGGVRGSFAQAGTGGFNQRFGTNQPAQWYRQNLEQLGGASSLREQQSNRSGGGGGGVPAPTTGVDDFGGQDPDEQGMKWEQFLRRVQGNMFGQGGR